MTTTKQAQRTPEKLPRVVGVGRLADHDRALVVYFEWIPSDANLRDLHESLRDNAHEAQAARIAELEEALQSVWDSAGPLDASIGQDGGVVISGAAFDLICAALAKGE